MRGAFFLDAGNARGHAFIATSPGAQRRFSPRAGKIGAMFDKALPPRRSLRCDNRIVQPSSLLSSPAVQPLRRQLFAILKMPVEAAFAHPEIARQQFDAHGFNSLGGKARKRGANPVVGLQWRRFKRSCGSHVVFSACRGTIPERNGRVKLRDCYFCDRVRRGENFRRVAEAWEPVHAGFFAKPGELALGKTPRGLLDLVYGVFLRDQPGEMFAQLRIADELKWLCVCGNAARYQSAHFFKPPGCEHRIGACMNACVEHCAGRQQADFDYFVALQRIAAAAMDLAHWFSSEQAQFDGANYFLRVWRRDARRGFWIETC